MPLVNNDLYASATATPAIPVNLASTSTESSIRTPISASVNIPSKRSVSNITPEDIKPFPKAAARISTISRKRGKTQILTDTPIKEQLAEEKRAKKTPLAKK